MRPHPLIAARLAPLAQRRHRFQLWWKLAAMWGGAALLAVTLLGLQKALGWSSVLVAPLLMLAGCIGVAASYFRFRRVETDWRGIALEVEKAHPELQGRLITALQQQPGPAGELNFLQDRLLSEVVGYANHSDWESLFPRSRLATAQLVQFGLLALFAVMVWQLWVPPAGGRLFVPIEELGIDIAPGDTELERGSSLVVSARFKGLPPSRVDMFVTSVSTNQRVELVKSLEDALFGGLVPELQTDISYYLEYAGRRTRDYRVKVFEYPRLERADARIEYPDYTSLPPRDVQNTRRVTAVEGSRIGLSLQLNKPVARATLTAKGTNQSPIVLDVESRQPLARLTNHLLSASATYTLHLVDLEGRTNKLPAQIILDALKNRTPELKIASPRGDTRPSPVEEIAFSGTVYDDYGVRAFGLASAVAGREIEFIELGRNVPGKEKQPYQFVLKLEDLGVSPDDLLSWFVWADDLGPDGQVRRTMGDLFFAEVRPFEEIFREGQSMSGNSEQQQQSGQQQGGQTGKLAELQKQIISATWKLLRESGTPVQPKAQVPNTQREKSGPRSLQGTDTRPVRHHNLFGQRASERDQLEPSPRARGTQRARPGRAPELASDIEVVREAQEQALEQAQQTLEEQRDPRESVLWEAAVRQMQRALEKLRSATNSPAQFQEALAAEQAAYQALLKLQEREYSVSRSRSRQQGQNSRQQQMQRQLDQLDLSQAENKYETERQAQAPQSAERSEQLQVLNRLQELARRQQDINQQLKELQTALQEAKSESEKEEIRKQLKRLQEEQQQLLADADEVSQRMERPENQSRMSEQRQQMEQVRSDLQRSAEAAQQGQTSQALAAGTRAERQLQQMRDELRRQNASEFEEELRRMRGDARELARQQEEIQKQMDTIRSPSSRNLSDAQLSQETLSDLAAQRERLTNLVNEASELARLTEDAEPLVSRELYDTVRNFSQNETSTSKQFQEEFINRRLTYTDVYQRIRRTTEQSETKTLDITSEMLRQGLLDDAALAEERARAGINDLRRGVEQAAQNVLGDDTETLRRAGQDLDRLTQQLQREIAQAGAEGTNGPAQELAQAGQGGRPSQESTESSPGGRSDRDRQAGDQQSDQTPSSQPGSEPNERSGTQPSGQGARQGQETREAQAREAQGREGQGGEAANREQQGAQAGSEQQRARGASGNRGNQDPRTGNRAAGGRTASGTGGNRFDYDLDRLLNAPAEVFTGPITGEDFAPWSDGLREVEEVVDTPSLRTEVARARERARQMRQDYKRNQKKPDWATVRLQILKPLVEVRESIDEELARRNPASDLVPIDRDPVPGRYSELVRRYYEQLGKDRGASAPADPAK